MKEETGLTEAPDWREMVHQLVVGNEAVCRTARKVLKTADDASDDPWVDLLTNACRRTKSTPGCCARCCSSAGIPSSGCAAAAGRPRFLVGASGALPCLRGGRGQNLAAEAAPARAPSRPRRIPTPPRGNHHPKHSHPFLPTVHACRPTHPAHP